MERFKSFKFSFDWNKNIDISEIFKAKKIVKANFNDISYPVKTGDTISKIAIKFGIDKDWILKWNEIEDASLIYPGDVLSLNLSELN